MENTTQSYPVNGVGSNGPEQSNSSYFTGETIKVEGILERLPDYGILRQEEKSDDASLPKDVYISPSQIKRFALRVGDKVMGLARPPKEAERYLSLLKVEKVDDMTPEEARNRPHFSKLTPIFPDEWMKLETTPEILSTRLIDLVSPIGKGQRAMIVAPPKAGKTWLLKEIAPGLPARTIWWFNRRGELCRAALIRRPFIRPSISLAPRATLKKGAA